MDSDEQQIRRLIDRWRIATAANDLQTILGLMTDDALFLTPGKPPMTKAAFATTFKGFSGRIRMEATQDIKEIGVSGDLAYCWSHIALVVTAIDTGEKNRRSGDVLTVFRKSPNGTWLLHRDANLLTAVS